MSLGTGQSFTVLTTGSMMPVSAISRIFCSAAAHLARGRRRGWRRRRMGCASLVLISCRTRMVQVWVQSSSQAAKMSVNCPRSCHSQVDSSKLVQPFPSQLHCHNSSLVALSVRWPLSQPLVGGTLCALVSVTAPRWWLSLCVGLWQLLGSPTWRLLHLHLDLVI